MWLDLPWGGSAGGWVNFEKRAGALRQTPLPNPFQVVFLHDFGRFFPNLNIHVFYFVVERLRLFGTFSHFFAAVLTAPFAFLHTPILSVRLWYAGVQACAEPARVL